MTYIFELINSIFLMNITISDSYNDFSCLKFGIFVETVTLAPSQISTNFLMEIPVEA